MTPEQKESTITAVTVMREMLEAGQLDLASFHQSLVCLAYDFAVAEEMAWAKKLLLEVPISYYEKEQPRQCVENPKYAELCLLFSKLIVMNGLVEGDLKPNHPPGIC